MKTSESFDGSLGLDSFMSPPKNNKSSTNLDTMASLTFSDATQNQSILRLNSIPKQFNYGLSKLSRIEQSSGLESHQGQQEGGSDKFGQLQRLQKWVRSSFNDYSQVRMRYKDNQANINKLEHRNKLKKDAITHIKNMTQYLIKKYQKRKEETKSKIIQHEANIRSEIEDSKKRSESLLDQIERLQEQVSEQRRIKKEIQRTKSSISNKVKHQQSLLYPNYPPFHYNNSGYYSHPTIYSSTSDYQDSHRGLHRSPSFEHATPQFVSKKTSINENANQNPFPITSELILQALAANLSSHSNHSSPTHKTQSTRHLPKLIEENQEDQDQEIETSKKPTRALMLSHLSSEDNNALYSPTNPVNTPQFDFNLNKDREAGFSDYHQKSNRQPEQVAPQKYKKKDSSKKLSIMEESKIRVQIDDTNSQMSKFSLEKRRRTQEQIMRESTIKIQMQEDDSKETSMLSDPTNTPRLRSPTAQPRTVNTSMDKVELQDISASHHDILKKPLEPPPRLPKQKKLRKITEQQSDMFDSNGVVRPDRKKREQRQKSQDIQIQDVMLNKQEIGVSQRPEENHSTPRLSTITKPQSKVYQRKETDEDLDNDDIMQINLLAVSKISKQKQFSQRNFKTISDDGNELPDFKKSSIIHKSQNIIDRPDPKVLQNVQQQQEFENHEVKKRQEQLRRIRKSSGSRFSQIKEPSPKANMQPIRH